MWTIEIIIQKPGLYTIYKTVTFEYDTPQSLKLSTYNINHFLSPCHQRLYSIFYTILWVASMASKRVLLICGDYTEDYEVTFIHFIIIPLFTHSCYHIVFSVHYFLILHFAVFYAGHGPFPSTASLWRRRRRRLPRKESRRCLPHRRPPALRPPGRSLLVWHIKICDWFCLDLIWDSILVIGICHRRLRFELICKSADVFGAFFWMDKINLC